MILYFFIFPPIFEKVVKWGSGSFEFYLLVRVISSWMPFDPGPFKGCYSVTSAERTFLMDWCAKRLDRGETLKHPFQTDAVASSWFNQSRDERRSKTRLRNKHQIIRRSNWSLRESQGKRGGERDVIRLRNPTEDKRAFRRMLTSAEQSCDVLPFGPGGDSRILVGNFEFNP